MKMSFILLIAVIIIAIATWLKHDFAEGLLVLGLGLIPVAIAQLFNRFFDEDD